jgi:hypothetical protein
MTLAPAVVVLLVVFELLVENLFCSQYIQKIYI